MNVAERNPSNLSVLLDNAQDLVNKRRAALVLSTKLIETDRKYLAMAVEQLDRIQRLRAREYDEGAKAIRLS